MFSVIIPLYNKANYIEKSINSILNQTYQNFELIIINDGSTDNSLVKVEKYNDKRLKIITQKNSGVSIARNNGVKVSSFENIVFLDADDWWDEHFLEEMNLLINNYPNAGLYGCKYFIVKNGNTIESKIGIDANFKAGYIDYFKVYGSTFWVPINCSFVIIKKQVFNVLGGFNESLKFGEDLDLWLRVALSNKIGYLNKFLAYSNQDVIVSERALGNNRIWKKEEHITFNLDYLRHKEGENKDLKYLLDGLKLRSLIHFYMEKKYELEVREILKTIDFKQHSLIFTFIYKFPKSLVLSYFKIKTIGSLIKQFISKNISI